MSDRNPSTPADRNQHPLKSSPWNYSNSHNSIDRSPTYDIVRKVSESIDSTPMSDVMSRASGNDDPMQQDLNVVGADSLLDDDEDIDEFVPASLASFFADAKQTLVRSQLDFFEDTRDSPDVIATNRSDDQITWETDGAEEEVTVLIEDENDARLRGEILNSLAERKAELLRWQESREENRNPKHDQKGKIEQVNRTVIMEMRRGAVEVQLKPQRGSPGELRAGRPISSPTRSARKHKSDTHPDEGTPVSSNKKMSLEQPVVNKIATPESTSYENDVALANSALGDTKAKNDNSSQGSYDPVAWLDEPDSSAPKIESVNAISVGIELSAKGSDILVSGDESQQTSQQDDSRKIREGDDASTPSPAPNSITKPAPTPDGRRRSSPISNQLSPSSRIKVPTYPEQAQSSDGNTKVDESRDSQDIVSGSGRKEQKDALLHNHLSAVPYDNVSTASPMVEDSVTERLGTSPNAPLPCPVTGSIHAVTPQIVVSSPHPPTVLAKEEGGGTAGDSLPARCTTSSRDSKNTRKSAQSPRSSRTRSRSSHEQNVKGVPGVTKVHLSPSCDDDMQIEVSHCSSPKPISLVQRSLSPNSSVLESATRIGQLLFAAFSPASEEKVSSGITRASKVNQNGGLSDDVNSDSAPVKCIKFTAETAERLSQPRPCAVYPKGIESPLPRTASPSTRKSKARFVALARHYDLRTTHTANTLRKKARTRFTAASAQRLSRPHHPIDPDTINNILAQLSPPRQSSFARFTEESAMRLSKPRTPLRNVDPELTSSAHKSRLRITPEVVRRSSKARYYESLVCYPVAPNNGTATKREFDETRNSVHGASDDFVSTVLSPNQNITTFSPSTLFTSGSPIVVNSPQSQLFSIEFQSSVAHGNVGKRNVVPLAARSSAGKTSHKATARSNKKTLVPSRAVITDGAPQLHSSGSRKRSDPVAFKRKPASKVEKSERLVSKPDLPPIKCQSRRLTIPHAPKFATDARLGPKIVAADAVVKSSESFVRGLRCDDASVGSGSSSMKKSLTIPSSPKFSTISRSRTKRLPTKESSDQTTWAQSSDSLQKGLRDGSPVVTVRHRGPTIPVGPKFQSIPQRQPPKSSEEKDLEEMERYKSNPFKANKVSETLRAVPTFAGGGSSPKRRITMPRPFHFHSGERKAAHKATAVAVKDTCDGTKQFKARPMPSFSQKKRGIAGVPRVISRPVTVPEPFTLSTDRAANLETPSFDVDSAKKPIRASNLRPPPSSVSTSRVPSSPTVAKPFHLSTSERCEKRIAVTEASRRRVAKLALEKEEQARIKEELRYAEAATEEATAKISFSSPPRQVKQAVQSPPAMESGRGLTELRPFNFETDKRHSVSAEKIQQRLAAEEEERSRQSKFKANPVPPTTYSPKIIAPSKC